MKFLFVINPTSGGTTKEKWEIAIADYFRTSKHQYEWYEMQGGDGDGDASSLKYWIKNWQPDRVVAVGGDGTLKFVAEQLLYTGMSIAFMPAGSANGMASELGLSSDIETALKVALRGQVRKMDVVRINNHISLHLSDIGLNAQLVKYFEESETRGMWGYAKEAFKVMRSKEQIDMELTVDGKRLERTAWMAIIANSRLYGTGAAVNPDGNVYDGRFEIVLIKQLSLWEILKMLLRNRRLNRKKTEILSAERVAIKTDKPIYFQVDGEYIGEVRALQATIEKGAVDMVVSNPQ